MYENVVLAYVHLKTVDKSHKSTHEARAEQDKQRIPSIVLWLFRKYVYLGNNWFLLILKRAQIVGVTDKGMLITSPLLQAG